MLELFDMLLGPVDVKQCEINWLDGRKRHANHFCGVAKSVRRMAPFKEYLFNVMYNLALILQEHVGKHRNTCCKQI